MAVTGLLFVGYLLLHMYGNLKIFGGVQAFDDYAHHLREFGYPLLPERGMLWIMRLVLILSLVGHAYAAFTLWARAARARGTRYVKKKAVAATWSSRTVRWGGVAILAFVIFHLLHFTTNTIQLAGDYPDSAGMRYVSSFQTWYGVLIYVVAMVAVGMHLRHGVWGAAMTLGLNRNASSQRRINAVAITVALVIVIGFLLPVFAVLLGVIE